MHDVFFYHTPFFFAPMFGIWMLFIAIIAVWSLVLKGFALWYSARAGQNKWFIVLLVVNTLGILEIIYLIWYRPKTSDSAVVPLTKEESAAQ